LEALLVVVVVVYVPSLVSSISFRLQWSSSDGCLAALPFVGEYFAAIVKEILKGANAYLFE
jgi:hypothetical protein